MCGALAVRGHCCGELNVAAEREEINEIEGFMVKILGLCVIAGYLRGSGASLYVVRFHF